MYEGLTAELLGYALPPGLESLRVVSGFVTSLDGSAMSGQIDCMVVVGEGEPVPYTGVLKYTIDKVLAVFEVKKNPKKQDYLDALSHLGDITKLLPDYLRACHLSDESTSRLLGYRPWHGDQTALKREQDAFVFRSALLAAYLPLKVIVSYHGYSRDSTLPSVIDEHLSRVASSTNMIGDLPDFVLDGDRGFVKLTGLPYATPVRDGWWLWFASLTQQPLLALLECLLWRLKPYVERDFPVFADHDDDPPMKAVFAAKLTGVAANLRHWKGDVPPEAQSFFRPEAGIEIMEWEFKMLFMFTMKRIISLDEIAQFVEQPLEIVKRSVGGLCRSGILFTNGSDVSVNSSSMRTVMDGNDGTYWVGEDCRGRFGRAQIRRLAAAKGEEAKILHVVTASNVDYTPISLASFDAGADNAGIIDMVSYENMKRAETLMKETLDEPPSAEAP